MVTAYAFDEPDRLAALKGANLTCSDDVECRQHNAASKRSDVAEQPMAAVSPIQRQLGWLALGMYGSGSQN